MGRQKLKLSKGTFYITFEMPHLSRHLFPENICSNLLKQLQNYVSLEIVRRRYFLKSFETHVFVPQEESLSSSLFWFKRQVKQNRGVHIKKETHPLAKWAWRKVYHLGCIQLGFQPCCWESAVVPKAQMPSLLGQPQWKEVVYRVQSHTEPKFTHVWHWHCNPGQITSFTITVPSAAILLPATTRGFANHGL